MLSFQYNTIKFYEFSPIKNEGSPLLALLNSKRLEISPKNACLPQAGLASPRSRRANKDISQLAVCVRKNSNRFRPKFVGRAEFPPDPPSARRTCPPLAEKRPFRIGKLPKNLKKYRLELYFGPKAGFPHF